MGSLIAMITSKTSLFIKAQSSRIIQRRQFVPLAMESSLSSMLLRERREVRQLM